MRWPWSRRREPAEPEPVIPPTNVRVRINDDEPVPVELEYMGAHWQTGIHTWQATALVPARYAGDRRLRVAVLADRIPPRTAIRASVIVKGPEEDTDG